MSKLGSRRRTGGARGENDAARFLVVTGLAREAACAKGEGLTTLCSGADAALLRIALEHVGGADFAGVVSFGLAGGLDYGLRPGDVVVGAEAISNDARFAAHPGLARILSEGFASAGARVATGAIAGVDAPVLDVRAKAALREKTGAIAVDMESHVAGAYAAARKLPFAIVRAVGDPAGRALPPLAATAVRPDGGVDIARVLRELAREPRQIGALVLAGLDARAAFASLSRCGPLLGPLLRLVLSDL